MSDRQFDSAAAGHAVSAFRERRVLVVGDLILDRYWWGTVNRISPEAPVPVVIRKRTSLSLGGAANVAANVVSLGGSATLVGLSGTDSASLELRNKLVECGIAADHLIGDEGRPTTVKTRIVAHGQHIVRVDEEETRPIEATVADQVRQRIASLLPAVDVVVISDYAKGLVTAELVQQIIQDASRQGLQVIVDPKGNDYARYEGAFLITPNRHEALLAAGFLPTETDCVRRAGLRLLETLPVTNLLITEGEAGMTLFEQQREPVSFPALARSVFDVTGAGDTVVAALSLTVAGAHALEFAVQLANRAAGLAVEQFGTAAVTAEQLTHALAT